MYIMLKPDCVKRGSYGEASRIERKHLSSVLYHLHYLAQSSIVEECSPNENYHAATCRRSYTIVAISHTAIGART